MEAVTSYMLDNSLEIHMQEILAEDIIKNLRPFVEEYIIEFRHYVHESLALGFDRAAIQNIISVLVSEVGNFLAMAEDATGLSDSPRTILLKSELQGMKTHLGVCFKALEKSLLDQPDIDRQMFLDHTSRIRSIR